MPLKQYIPISVAVFALLVAGAYALGIPVVPVAIIIVLAETALGFMAEEGRVARFTSGLVGAIKNKSH